MDSVFVEPLIEVPANVVIVLPKDTDVDPIVIAELVSAAFGIFENVFKAPDIVLFVRT